MLKDTLLETAGPQAETLETMERHGVTRFCWMCGHCQPNGSGYVCANAKAMLEQVVGTQLRDVRAWVTEETRADSCVGFILTADPGALADLTALIGEAEEEGRRHDEHYAYLDRSMARESLMRAWA